MVWNEFCWILEKRDPQVDRLVCTTLGVLSQVDEPADLSDGSVPGVKNAAVRKLYHELGIPAEHVPIDSFKFLTRLHYYAADALTHGPNSPWGEHEVDYILFIQVSFAAYGNATLSYDLFRKMGLAITAHMLMRWDGQDSVPRQCGLHFLLRPSDQKSFVLRRVAKYLPLLKRADGCHTNERPKMSVGNADNE